VQQRVNDSVIIDLPRMMCNTNSSLQTRSFDEPGKYCRRPIHYHCPMYLPGFLNLGVGFRKYFVALPALNDELKRAAYRIRHSVYCEDLGYEALRADGLETDEYDAQATHCLLQGVVDPQYVGCIRLVVPRRDDPQRPLPFEVLCGTTLDRTVIDPGSLPRDRIAEVSRLAVIRQYRRRKGEAARPGGDIDDSDFGTVERPRFPYIPVGLYLGMLAQARRQGIETLFVLTEPRLASHLSRLGVRLTRIGAPVEHRGTRVPSMMRVNEVIEGFGAFVRPLFDVIAGEIVDAYRAAGA
jgi:N-acyl amino acid synthase of PEP-CTERM/exosortase system